jgi:hypothetical protein
MKVNKENISKIGKENKDKLNKYGHVIHYVFSKKDGWNEDCSIHTHGVLELYKHLDLEIKLPLPQNVAMGVLNGMVESIKKGVSFENKLISDEVLKGYDVQLVRVNDGSRELIRVIIPDENGKFPGDKDCKDVYKNQLDDYIKNNKILKS